MDNIPVLIVVLLVILFGVIVITSITSNDNSEVTEQFSTIGQVLNGDHLLSTLTFQSAGDTSLQNSYFLLSDDGLNVYFKWLDNDSIYQITTLPLGSFQVEFVDSLENNFVRFKWNTTGKSDTNNIQSIMDENVLYAKVFLNLQNDWNLQFGMIDSSTYKGLNLITLKNELLAVDTVIHTELDSSLNVALDSLLTDNTITFVETMEFDSITQNSVAQEKFVVDLNVDDNKVLTYLLKAMKQSQSNQNLSLEEQLLLGELLMKLNPNMSIGDAINRLQNNQIPVQMSKMDQEDSAAILFEKLGLQLVSMNKLEIQALLLKLEHKPILKLAFENLFKEFNELQEKN